MSTDPFEQLQQLADPLAPPEARFVARLRQRVTDALTQLPTIDLPERSTTVSTPHRHEHHHAVHLRESGERSPGLVPRMHSVPSRRSATPETTGASGTPRC